MKFHLDLGVPEIGRVIPEFNEKDIRELIHPPFRVVFFEVRSK